jgi:hypothetical protein
MSDMREDFRRQLHEVVEAGKTGHVSPASAVRARGDQRRRRKAAGVAALSLVLIAGAIGGFMKLQPNSQPGTLPANPAPATAEPSPAPKWARGEQTVQVSKGELRGGQLQLTMRRAEKEILGESLDVLAIPGEQYTDVVVPGSAQFLELDGKPLTAEQFLSGLDQRNPDKNPVPCDVTFDGQGGVTKAQFLFAPPGG